MADPGVESRFRSLAWFAPVCLLICLAAVSRSWIGARFPEHTLRDGALRSFAFLIPLIVAIELTQRMVLARSNHPRAFGSVLAACLVAVIAVVGFLLLLVFATFFAPAPPM